MSTLSHQYVTMQGRDVVNFPELEKEKAAIKASANTVEEFAKASRQSARECITIPNGIR